MTVFGGPAPQTVDVPDTASLQQIIARVAKACSVAPDSVRVSCNDRRCVHEVCLLLCCVPAQSGTPSAQVWRGFPAGAGPGVAESSSAHR